MAKEGSVAPKERINIVYKPATGDGQEELELPLKLMVMGDFTNKEDDTAIEDRDVLSVDKNNFDEVLSAQDINLNFTVNNALSDEDDDEIPVELSIGGMKDFEPESIARQVPEVNALLELREALTTLKGPMGNVPAFRKLLQSMVTDEDARKKLLDELEADE